MDVENFLAAAGELLAVPSTADRPAELERALGYVLEFVGTGFTVERFTSAGKPSALVYPEGHGAAGRPRFRVILNAHLDVVPAPPEQFRPRRDEMRLYARGAQDMKVSALAEALAFRDLAGPVGYPLALQLVTDEEVGGRNGTRYQVDHLDAPQNADGARPEIARLAEAARAQGYRPDFLRKHGTGDGRFYGEAGMTAVAFGVGGHGQHGADEYADITTIAPYYRALTQFLRDPWAGEADGDASG